MEVHPPQNPGIHHMLTRFRRVTGITWSDWSAAESRPYVTPIIVVGVEHDGVSGASGLLHQRSLWHL